MSSNQQSLDDRTIQRRQTFQLIECDMLVDLVDARIGRPEFDNLRSERRDETAVRSAPARAHFRVLDAAMLGNRRECRIAQCAGTGQERFAGKPPVESACAVTNVDALVTQDFLDAFTQ